MLRVFIITVLVVGALGACKKDVAPPSECPEEISYQNDVKPIVMQNCAVSGCHDVNAASGYDFTLYSTVSGNAELMLSSMRHETGTTPMPIGNNKLADSIIGKFSCWIAQGKLNN